MAPAHRHDHDHQHGHDHSHGSGGHAHAPASFGKAFAIGILLNIVFVAIEATYGVFSYSLALLADAGHNLSDVLSLAIHLGSTIHGKLTEQERLDAGITPGLIRLSIGLESVRDIIDDLERALVAAGAAAG